jgi:tripartite-type tricarboxylate transporter receptor subunit TctC
MKKKGVLWMLIALFATFIMPGEKLIAQEVFPSKPITLLVGFPPGGVSDIAARALTPAASKYLGQPVVVLNKPGAGGTLAVDFLANSKPDGYTLMNAGSSTLAYGMYTEGVSWGPKDFTVILGHSNYNRAIVMRADAPWKNFDEWVQYVKQNPGFKYGAYGYLGSMHVMMEWIGKRLGLKMIPVHYKGDADGITALLGGHIQIFLSGGGHVPLVKAGKLKTLLQEVGDPVDQDPKAVARLKEVLPDAPMEVVALPIGIFGPKGIPVPIQAKLQQTLKKATVENPEFIKVHQQMNMQIEYHDPKELQAILNKAYENFGTLMKDLGLERK